MDLLKQSEQLNQRVGEPQAYALIRSLAAKQFTALHWPTKKLEAWRYSPVQRLQSEHIPQINFEDIKSSTKKSNASVITNQTVSSNQGESQTHRELHTPGEQPPPSHEGLQIHEQLPTLLASITNPHFESIIFYNGTPLDWAPKMDETSVSSSSALSGSVIKAKASNTPSATNTALFEIKTLKQALSEGLIDSASLKTENNKLEALNLSYFDQGYVVYLHENAVINKPIHIIHLYSSTEEKPLFQSRLHIIAAKNSHSTVLETHYVLNKTETALSFKAETPQSSNYTSIWNNSTSVVEIKDEAHLTFIQWSELPSVQQDTHRTHITLQNKSHLHLLQGSFCEGWRRSELTITPQGSDAEIIVHSLGLSKKDGIVDQPSVIDFAGPNNQCQQIVKNLLLNQSRAIFNGHIKIQPSAQKTNSSQLHQSLLLSAEAEVDSKPELEIYADDVQATHGATVGQLNADELFYFQSRGISKEKAYSLICLGFLTELCDHLPNQEIQTYLKSRISDVWMKEEQ